MRQILLILVCISIIVSSCTPTVSGSGELKEKEYLIAHLSEIEVSGNFDVYVRQGKEDKMMIKADDNFFEYIEVDENSHGVGIEMKRIPRNITALEIYLEVTDLNQIRLNGAIDFEAREIRGDGLALEVNGASELNLSLDYHSIELLLNGASTVHLDGESNEMKAQINGASDLFAKALKSKKMSIEVNGAGNAEVWVTDELEVNVHGAGNIEYIGSPNLNQQITGAGSVKRMED